MEKDKEIINFGAQQGNTDIVSSKPSFAPSRNKREVQDEKNLIEIKLDKGVTIKLVKDNAFLFTKELNLKDIIEIDNAKPDLIHSFHPPLYKDFITSKGQINTHVNIGNIVKVKRKFMDDKEDIPREVTNLYFKSLNNMTVITAVLNDNDFYVASRLEICK